MVSMKAVLCGASALLFAGSAHAATLAKIDFDNPIQMDVGVFGSFGPTSDEIASAGAWNAAGWSGHYGANRTTGDPAVPTTLSLHNLAPHSTITASFILGFLESWDSLDGGCCAPDHLEIWIDDVLVADMTANNALGTINDFDGGSILAQYVQANANTYYSDTLVNMAGAPFLTFAHSSSDLKFAIRASGRGWQGGADEAWGMDNFLLTYDGKRGAVPEPATWALMIGGFGMAGAALRRRRARA